MYSDYTFFKDPIPDIELIYEFSLCIYAVKEIEKSIFFQVNLDRMVTLSLCRLQLNLIRKSRVIS